MKARISKGNIMLQKIIPAIIILAGIALRLYVYTDNRNLWTDEVNIALNIFEKGFGELAVGLDYKQYAPPVFLWITKLNALIFGYGEQALRLYPLLTGIASLLLLYSIARKSFSAYSTWYVLLLLATGIFYLRYSTELKQYMPDAFISLLLVWLALRVKMAAYTPKRFVLIWLVAGSIAIWSSMPSVFVLAGVGCYYLSSLIRRSSYKKYFHLLLVCSLWLVQFLIYYYLVLQQHIQSDYLVSYHEKYFLFATPTDAAQWTHNKDLIKAILEQTFSSNSIVLLFNIVLSVLGVVLLILKKDKKIWLFLAPVLLMLAAAALNQYSLIPRLALFAMPLILLLAGAGLDVLFVRNPALIKVGAGLLCITALISTKPLQVINEPLREEQVTEAMDYAIKKGITGDELYVYTGAGNAFRYYTNIHPDKENLQSIRGAYIIPDGIDAIQLADITPDTVALLYTIPFDSYHFKKVFSNNMQLTDSFETDGSSVFIFRKPL